MLVKAVLPASKLPFLTTFGPGQHQHDSWKSLLRPSHWPNGTVPATIGAGVAPGRTKLAVATKSKPPTERSRPGSVNGTKLKQYFVPDVSVGLGSVVTKAPFW